MCLKVGCGLPVPCLALSPWVSSPLEDSQVRPCGIGGPLSSLHTSAPHCRPCPPPSLPPARRPKQSDLDAGKQASVMVDGKPVDVSLLREVCRRPFVCGPPGASPNLHLNAFSFTAPCAIFPASRSTPPPSHPTPPNPTPPHHTTTPRPRSPPPWSTSSARPRSWQAVPSFPQSLSRPSASGASCTACSSTHTIRARWARGGGGGSVVSWAPVWLEGGQ
jgi:hypothetical protein